MLKNDNIKFESSCGKSIAIIGKILWRLRNLSSLTLADFDSLSCTVYLRFRRHTLVQSLVLIIIETTNYFLPIVNWMCASIKL